VANILIGAHNHNDEKVCHTFLIRGNFPPLFVVNPRVNTRMYFWPLVRRILGASEKAAVPKAPG